MPDWPNQYWYVSSIDLLVESAFFIQPSEDQLYLPNQHDTIHSLSRHLELMACKLPVKYFNIMNCQENATDILMKSRSCSTSKQFSPHLLRWIGFILVNASINDSADFLMQYFFGSEYEYSVINTARSVLSSIFPSEKGLTFGKQHITQSF